ncbi:MAG TPA: ATP-binding protein [Propionibacteriaceae bacterium]|nr:ATP-binding protein [Propionibacteriaceae bacterium]
MSLELVALASGAAGLAVGALGLAVVRRPRATPEEASPAIEPTVPVVVPDEAIRLLGLLQQPALIVGPHDEVLHSTAIARSLGVSRGARVVPLELLELIRKSRRAEAPYTARLDIPRGMSGTADAMIFRVVPTSTGSVLVVGEDLSGVARAAETSRDFVANVSHELKTPIGAMSLLSEAVDAAADDPEAVRHFAERLTVESRRLADLVTQIISLSRLQSVDPLLGAAEVSVDDVIRASVDRCTQMAASRRITVTIASDPSLVVLGDEGQLVDAVTNLLANAIAYSDPDTHVVISSVRGHDEDADEVAEIRVSDHGIGINPEDQERIFERFYRVSYARSRDNGGTGLGLSIVKHIARAHGGTISVWSLPGDGSTFTLRLPTHTPLARPADAQPVPVTQTEETTL